MSKLLELFKLVEEQANDEGLWVDPIFVTEAMLLQALTELHRAIKKLKDE